jgi:hypothetical protein
VAGEVQVVAAVAVAVDVAEGHDDHAVYAGVASFSQGALVLGPHGLWSADTTLSAFRGPIG